jgi:hypothetical protein
VAEQQKIILLKIHVFLGLHLLLSQLELVDNQPDYPTGISEVGGCMDDIVGEVYEDPEGDGFLAVIPITANHIDHHIAD